MEEGRKAEEARKKEVKDPDYENATLSNEIRGEVNFEKFD